MKETFTVKLTYEMSVDTDTGEILATKLIDRSIDNSDLVKKSSGDGKEPTLVLESNKYRLNNAAIELLGLDENSKLSIKYIQENNGDLPVIAVDPNGNKLSKSHTVACRGRNRDELAKYGEEFTLVPHPSKPGLFILTSDKPEQPTGDENIHVDEDFSLEGLIDDEDTNITEVDSNFFKL